MKSRRAAIALRGIQVALAAFALVLLARLVPPRAAWDRLASIPLPSLGALVLLSGLPVLFAALRWSRLVARLGGSLAVAEALRETLVGLGASTVLPGAVGGDAVRVLRVRAALPEGVAASSVVADRLAGLVALAAAAAAGTAATLGSRLPTPVWIGIAATPLALACLASVAPRAMRSLRGPLGRVARDLDGPLASRGARAEALAWSFLAHGAGVLFVVLAARALGAPGHELALVVGLPVVLLLSLAPVTPGGLGLREGLFVAILARLGVPEDVALALGLAWLASCLLCGALGAVLLAATSARASGSMRQSLGPDAAR